MFRLYFQMLHIPNVIIYGENSHIDVLIIFFVLFFFIKRGGKLNENENEVHISI